MSSGLSRGRTLESGTFGLTADQLPSYDTLEEARFDPRSLFAHPEHPFEIEIGSGKGTFLVQQAALQKDVNFLGIEWAKPFYAYAADRLRRHGLENARMLHTDASEFVRVRCPDAIAHVVHLYFSDPWPKARHHKRRVLQSHTLHEFHRVLKPSGRVHLVTDHDDLWAWYESLVVEHGDLFDRTVFRSPESAQEGEIIGTNFERKYQREGRPFHAMTLVRRP